MKKVLLMFFALLITGQVFADSPLDRGIEGKIILNPTKIGHNDNITRHISPNSTVMVYKHDYIPYIAPLLLQNVDLSKSQYVIASDVTAGYAIDIDSNRTQGDVTVKSGVEYEIETSGTVTFQGGFKVEKGATFAVYPSCF